MLGSDLGVYLPATIDRPALAAAVQRLEDERYHSVWFTETDLVRDPVVHAAAASVLSEELVVGVGLVNVWRQLPASLATTVANVSALAAGRHWVVLGPWHEPAATKAGVRRHHLIEAMRDTTIIVRGLLRGETVTHEGPVYAVHELAMPGRAGAADVPLLWGANGPRMVAEAAELTAAGLIDGVMINYLTPVERVREIIALVTSAAIEAGRGPGTLKFPIALIVLPDDDRHRAVEQMRSLIEGTAVLRAEMHLSPDAAVTYELVEQRVAAGTAAQCQARIQEYLDAGAWPVALYNREPQTLMDRLSQSPSQGDP